eukprot:TRINITY_DN112_c0_g2_i2.p1 TRINITY_DN112_c0_g2~~TRINITY_DN112_c0_g2_i2.p1  ORF type:complete len:181 (-),score=58.98 TRINITY_DN112_c0_g2_i2:56-529(-)
MGRVRTKTVKKAARLIVEKYYPKLTLDFHFNKRITAEVAEIPSKRLRNKIAGYTTHLMKRIQRGPVRGISFKLQEEERERKDNYVPEVSAIVTTDIQIDAETKALLRSMDMDKLPGVQVLVPQTTTPPPQTNQRVPRPPRTDRRKKQDDAPAATAAV